jgi:hypothetical protein
MAKEDRRWRADARIARRIFFEKRALLDGAKGTNRGMSNALERCARSCGDSS